MLIPQTIGLGHTEHHKSPYLTNTLDTSSAIVAAAVSNAAYPTSTATGDSIGLYPPNDSCIIAGRMQSATDLPSLYSSSQAGSSALASPVGYGTLPGAPSGTHSFMQPHYPVPGADSTHYYPPLVIISYNICFILSCIFMQKINGSRIYLDRIQGIYQMLI